MLTIIPFSSSQVTQACSMFLLTLGKLKPWVRLVPYKKNGQQNGELWSSSTDKTQMEANPNRKVCWPPPPGENSQGAHKGPELFFHLASCMKDPSM